MKETVQTRYAQIANLENLPQILRALKALQSELTCATDGASSSSAEQVDWEQRVELVIEAIETPSPIDSLTKIQEMCCLCEADPALDTIMRLIERRAREHLTVLKQQAQTAIQNGALSEAEELLLKLRMLDLGDVETNKLYADVRQRRVVEEKLRSIEQDANTKIASNSPVDAMKTLRQGLNVALGPDVNLPSRAREILRELVALGDRDDGSAFGQPDNWQTALDLTAELGGLRSENWVAGRIVPLLDQWIRLGRDNALRGLVASAAQLGNLLLAYRAAADYLKAHPQEPFAIQQWTERQESLINQLNESAKKRLHRAGRALDTGDFGIALHNLQDIEADFYAPVDQDFPGLLDGYDEVQAVRDEVVELQAEAEKLQVLHTQTAQQLDAARQAYQQRDWDTAEQTLDALPMSKLKEALPDLYAQIEGLQTQITSGRTSEARTQLQQVLSRIETGRNLATTTEQLDSYLGELEALQQQINLHLLDVDERNRYFALLTEVRDQRESLAAGVLWEEKIKAHLHDENYREALAALDEALTVTREAKRMVDLKSQRNHIAKLAQAQTERETLLSQGQQLFAEEQYVEARTQFMLARQKGVEVIEWLNAARAGVLLQNARKFWREDHDGPGALASLEEVERLAKDNVLADELLAEARRLQAQVEEARRGTSKINEALAEARRLLGAADLEGAQENIHLVLKQNPKDQDALELQAQIQAHTKAQSMLSEVRADQEAGRYKEALQRVLTVLELTPASSEAKLLKQQLEAVTQADQAIIEVEMLAKQAQFKEARARLTELSRQGIDPDKLRDTQKLIEDLEKEQWSKIIQPIEDDYRDGLYAEAWNRAKQAVGRTATPDLLDELNHLQGLIVNRWAEQQVADTRESLRQSLDVDQLRALEAQLEPFLTIEPALEGHWQRQIESLLRETRTQRLRARIEQAREQYESWIAADHTGDPQGALNILKTVQEEVEQLGTQIDFDVILDANTLEDEIREATKRYDEETREAQRLREAQERQTERDRWFEAAYALQQKLEDPAYLAKKSPGRVILEQINEQVNKVFKISGYEQDAAARELREWAQSQLKAYDSTHDILNDVRDLVGRHDFRGADNALRRTGMVSSLLKTEYDRWRDIVSVLRRADTAQNNGSWDVALQNYQQALAHAPHLEVILEKDIERCHSNLLKQVQETVSQALTQTPPATTAARAVLTQAENSKWIATHNQRDYDHLRDWLVSQEEVTRAADILQAEDGDPTEAYGALQEARRLLPRDQSDASIRQWEMLVEALKIWQEYKQQPSLLPRALQAFRELQLPIADLARVQQLRRQLEAETEHRRIASAEAAEREDLLKQLTGQITAALSHPQDYVGAVRALENASSKITGDAQFATLCLRVQEDMRTAMETAIQEWHYAQALEWAEILKRLPRLDPVTRDWAIGLPSDQRDALNAKLQEANAALETHDQSRVLAALKDAEKIAAPHGDARINGLYERLELDKLEAAFYRAEQALARYAPGEVESALKEAKQIPNGGDDKRFETLSQRLNELRRLLDDVHARLREINILIGQNQWQSAVEHLLEVRNDTPYYDHVTLAMSDLQDRLVAQAEVERKAGKFAQGLALCDYSQRLGLRDDVHALQDQIRVDQENAVADLRKRVRMGLESWRLEPLSRLLTHGLQIVPNDDELLKLNERYQKLEAALPEIREQMALGWEQLQKRDHIAAIGAFERAFNAAPYPLLEAHLWRDYTRALRDAAIIAEDGDDFSQIAQLLGEAASLMYRGAGQILPDVFSSSHHLEERHRHAAYNAWRLRQMARRMAQWYRISDEYYARGDSKSMEEGIRLFDLVVDERNRFKRTYLSPTAPPDSFSLTGAADEPLPVVVRPESNTSRAEATKNAPAKPDVSSAPPEAGGAPRKPKSRPAPSSDTTAASVPKSESPPISTEGTVPVANWKKKDNLFGRLFKRGNPSEDTSDNDGEELDDSPLGSTKPDMYPVSEQFESTGASAESVAGGVSPESFESSPDSDVPVAQPISPVVMETEAPLSEESTEDYLTDLDGLGDFFKDSSNYTQDAGDET